MIQQDYILRLIEMIAALIARILFHKDAKALILARQTLIEGCSSILGLDYLIVRRLSTEALLDLLSTEGIPNPGKCLVVAEVMNQDAGLLDEESRPAEANVLRVRSVTFYLEALHALKDDQQSKYVAKIESVLAKLNDHCIPSSLLRKVLRFFERTGSFAKGEDFLFKAVHAGARGSIEEGVAFYEALLKKDDHALSLGNLPRQEVEEGLQELKAADK
jgi:hypothetical protein